MSARIRFISVAVLAVSLALLSISFATSDGGGRTRFGSELGADYAGFYTAGWILNHRPAADLYDTEKQDRVHHTLHPHVKQNEKLPFLHPPFVAVAFRPLAQLPYVWSFAVWLTISLGLYLVGLVVTLRMLHLSRADRLTALLAALSFEPFIMECWQGGQLSALGFCCFAVAVFLDTSSRRRFMSGMVLGLCFYKPTLLVAALPALAIARRWQTLLGLATTGAILALLSFAAVGTDGCMAFVDKLLGFSRTATENNALVLKEGKYVDLNAFTRLLLGAGLEQKLLLAVLALPAFAMLLFRARELAQDDVRQRRLFWAIVLLATPVLNIYVGLYDTVLVSLGALLLIDFSCESNKLWPRSLGLWLAALYVTPWFTQPLAKLVHVQFFTLVLLGAFWWTCVRFTTKVEQPVH
jgi:arabinofuranan 3-O-arabinosyltransferase